MKATKSPYHLKGFTIAELLVVLALTSVSITLSCSTLTYVQKLFSEYKKQNKFLSEFTDLKKRLDYESLKANSVIESSENNFLIQRDSLLSQLQIKETYILLHRNDRCDTFHVSARNIKKEYERMENPMWTNKLLNSLSFDVEYTKQKFSFTFTKKRSAALKLRLDEEN